MDAALRRVHAALRHSQVIHAALNDRDARGVLLTAPEGWSAVLRECTDRLADRDIDETTRQVIIEALRDAGNAWQERNRYMHDLLVDSIDIDDHPAKIERCPRGENDRYRMRLTRRKGAPEHVTVSVNDGIELVHALVAARWRLSAARNVLATGSPVWRGMLLAHVEGSWEGSASWVGPADEED